MSEAAATDLLACRTCGKPRGDNVANGTRCARCGYRQSVMVCAAAGIGMAYLGTSSLRHAAAAAIVGAIVAPFAWVATAAVHELGHAVTAWLLGQTVTRIVIGEGRAFWTRGRDPQIVIGSVVMGNALTNVVDLRPDGYRARAALVLLAAPIVSAVSGVFVLMVDVFLLMVGGPMPIQAAAVLFVFFSFAMTVITLIPVPTFGGRVWSDLAGALYLLRASEPEIEEHMLIAAQDRIVVLLETGTPELAIETGRRAIEAAPRAPLAYSLLAYALHQSGRIEEAATVATSALDLAQDEPARTYLRQFISAPTA
jgi:hypothetical protein